MSSGAVPQRSTWYTATQLQTETGALPKMNEICAEIIRMGREITTHKFPRNTAGVA